MLFNKVIVAAMLMSAGAFVPSHTVSIGGRKFLVGKKYDGLWFESNFLHEGGFRSLCRLLMCFSVTQGSALINLPNRTNFGATTLLPR